jgi:hypothetical protein
MHAYMHTAPQPASVQPDRQTGVGAGRQRRREPGPVPSGLLYINRLICIDDDRHRVCLDRNLATYKGSSYDAVKRRQAASVKTKSGVFGCCCGGKDDEPSTRNNP